MPNSYHLDRIFSPYLTTNKDSHIVPFIMPPTLKMLVGHIAFGLSVGGCLTLFYASCNCKTMHARVLKFHIRIPDGKIADMYLFSFLHYASFKNLDRNLVSKISQKLFELRP